MAKKKDTYIAGQTIHNRVEYDEAGNKVLTQQVIYEQKEFVNGYVDVKLPHRHKFNNGGFITVFQEALSIILQYGKLTKVEYQLLIYVLANAGIDGSINTDLDTMSEILKTKKPNVSTALKGLVERNIIIRRDGKRYERTPLPIELSFNYDRLNYNLAYNGKTRFYKQKKNNHPAISVPGDEKGEWIDVETGNLTIERQGVLLQQSLFNIIDDELPVQAEEEAPSLEM